MTAQGSIERASPSHRYGKWGPRIRFHATGSCDNVSLEFLPRVFTVRAFNGFIEIGICRDCQRPIETIIQSVGHELNADIHVRVLVSHGLCTLLDTNDTVCVSS